VVVLLGMLAGAYLYAHHARPLPPPLWTEADLPELPPAEDNGWVLLRDRGYAFSVDDEGGLLSLETSPQELPEDTARAIADELRGDEPARREIGALGHFADGCATTDTYCPFLPMHYLAVERGLAMIVGARLGHWTRVTEEAEALSRQTSGFTATCRTVASCLVAVRALENSMIAAESVAFIASNADDPPIDVLEALVELVASAVTPSPDVGRTIVFDCVSYRRTFAALNGELLLDRAYTLGRLDDMCRSVHAYAVDPTLGAPTGWPQTDGALWWLYNARGKEYLAMYAVNLETSVSAITRYREVLEDIDAARARALEALRRAITHAEAQAEARANQAANPDTTDE